MSFAEKFNELMNETGMTNYRLAKLLNVHQTTIANWRTGIGLSQHPKGRRQDSLHLWLYYICGNDECNLSNSIRRF